MFSCRFVFKGHCIQNIVWPPIQDEPEFPTASPLYFPPPSQVAQQEALKVNVKEEQNFDYYKEQVTNQKSLITAEQVEFNEIESLLTMEPKMSLCSAEVTSITGRRSVTHCIESLTDALDTQILVDSIIKKRPKSPPPIDADILRSADSKTNISNEPSNFGKSIAAEKESTLLESRMSSEHKPTTIRVPDTLECNSKKPNIKVVNAVPQKWESPMVAALTITPENLSDSSSFSQIPTKRSTTALASALAVAPAVPFTPVPITTLEPVPLPEETEPYFPPERPIVSNTIKDDKKNESSKPKSESRFVKALQIAPERPYTPVAEQPLRKKKQPEDKLLKDLPKPEKILTMREALATAPETPYPPFISEITVKFENPIRYTQEDTEAKIDTHHSLHKPLKPAVLPPSFQPLVITSAKPCISNFPPISDELKSTDASKTDYSEVKCELSSQILQQSTLNEQDTYHTKTNTEQISSTQKQSSEQTICSKSQMEVEKQTFIQSSIEKQSEDTIYKKPLPLTSYLHPPDSLPRYQVNLSEDAEMELLLMEKLQSAKNLSQSLEKNQSTLECTQTMPSNTAPKKPLITVHADDIMQKPSSQMFRPVTEDERVSASSVPPRTKSLTPSMINKPISPLPYYQTNLVAQEHLAPEINVFDPKSPAISRSPSPCLERRSVSPFHCTNRSKSPAAGPPPNPLLNINTKITSHNTDKSEARKSVINYIPQYKDKHDSGEYTNAQTGYKGALLGSQNPIQMDSHSMKNNEAKGQECAAECVKSRQQISSFCNQQGKFLTKTTEKSDNRHLEQSRKMDSKTSETSTDGLIQIERKRTIQEEFEHTHKSNFIQIEKSVNSAQQQSQSFRNINTEATEEFFQHGIVGLHVTNPQPIVSPFISAEKGAAVKSASEQKTYELNLESTQSTNSLSHNTKGVSKPLPKTNFTSSNTTSNHKNTAVPLQNVTPSSNQCHNRPNIPIPHSGVGGGRQAGAIGVAPKRGRGILNVAALTGSRIPLCGHCHSHIRYRV